jgi:hypothetical protein
MSNRPQPLSLAFDAVLLVDTASPIPDIWTRDESSSRPQRWSGDHKLGMRLWSSPINREVTAVRGQRPAHNSGTEHKKVEKVVALSADCGILILRSP